MRKLGYLAVLVLVAGFFAAPALAGGRGEAPISVTVHGEERIQMEYFDNLTDLQDHDEGGDDDFLDDNYNIWGIRSLVGVNAEFSDNVSSFISMQHFATFGDNPPPRGFNDPIRQFEGADDPLDNGDVQILEGWINIENIGDSPVSLKIGRQEHAQGTELHLGDWDYYLGQTFDGVHLQLERERFSTDTIFYVIDGDANQGCGLFTGGGSDGPGCGDDDQILYGTFVNIPIKDGEQEIEPYLLSLDNSDEDNGTIASLFPIGGGLNVGKFTVRTVGARWSSWVEEEDDGLIDWNLEAAMQFGEVFEDETFEQDAGGYIAEGWIGFNFFRGDSAHHRIHAGFLMASGDDDLTDGDWDAYIPLFPDTHSYNRLSNIDMDNMIGLTFINDYNFGYQLSLREDTHNFMVSLHMLQLAEDSAVGAGPGDCFVDGDPGIGTSCEDDIGMAIDLGYNYYYTSNLAFGVDFSMFMGGDAADAFTQDAFGEDSDEAIRTRLWTRLRF